MAVIETARHLAGLPNASSAEFGDTDAAVISYMNSWEGTEGAVYRKADGDLGGTMRLGAYPCQLRPGSRIASIYGTEFIKERHRHRYEVNPYFRDQLEDAGMHFQASALTVAYRKLSSVMTIPGLSGCNSIPN